MAKYQLTFVDTIRGITIQTNTKNNKQRIFLNGTLNGQAHLFPFSKEYNRFSFIAPRQKRDNYVMFVASGKKDKTLFMNDGQTIKLKNWESKIQPINVNRSYHCVQYEIFPEGMEAKNLQTFVQDDGLILFKHKNFGEVLYDNKHDALSPTVEHISNPDKNGYRIVCLDTNMLADERMAYMDNNFNIVDKPFYKFLHNHTVDSITQNLELVCQKCNDTFTFYFLDENHLPCSKKYDDINTVNKQIVATTLSGKQVLLNGLAQEISPHFVDFKQFGDNFILQTDKHLNKCVLLNPSLETNKVSVQLTKTKSCQQHNILMGDVVIGEQKRCVIINAAAPDKAFAVDPCVGMLMMSHLNGKRLSAHFVDKIIDKNDTIKQTLTAFNDCLNLSLEENKQSKITDKENVCHDFLSKLKQCANYRIRKFKQQSSILHNETREMEAQYFGMIEEYQQELDQLELQRQITEAHYKNELIKQEEQMALRNQEIAIEQQQLQEQANNMQQLKDNLSILQVETAEALTLE